MTERDFEQEASSEGWRPQEEWKGDPDKWVTAETFVERGEKIAGILKSKVDRLSGEVQHLKQSNAKFGEYHKKTIQKERDESEQKIHALELMLSEAVDNGDGKTFTKVNRELDNLKQNMPAVEPEFSIDPIEAQWLTDNPWYNSDPQLRAMADGVSNAVDLEGFMGQARLDEISRRTKESFPDKFGNPNRKREANVGDGDPIADAPVKEKSFKNLPKDAKDACNEFVSDGFMTQEEYVKQYYSEDE